jgi:uncharacterized membrane protein
MVWHKLKGLAKRDGAPVLLLSLIGLAVSLFLSYLYLSGSRAFCDGVGGCDYVASSNYSKIAGVPVPILGVVGYLFIALISIGRWRGLGYRSWILLATFGAALFGFLFSLFLTYVELFVLFAVCPWCMASAVAMTGVFIISVRDLLAG